MHQPFFVENLSPLYEAVQESGIFLDSKFFPDCGLNASPEVILVAFEAARAAPNFDLKSFVETYFIYPKTESDEYSSANKSIETHLENLWKVLLRPPTSDSIVSTLLTLQHAYIVPGGRFREIYYWDSYFTMLGLRESGRADLIENMVENFADLIDNHGFIPNGNRSYYLSRSQPPFFAMMVDLLSEIKGTEILLKYQSQLEKEYDFWMQGAQNLAPNAAHRRVVRLPDGHFLNRYWDDKCTPRPEAFVEDVEIAEKSAQSAEKIYRNIRAAAESGWDFSSRWFADGQNMSTIQTTDLLPVDLNCLLYFLEKTLLKIYVQQSNRALEIIFEEKIRLRIKAIQHYFWDEKSNFYVDFNFVTYSKSTSYHLAAAFPLFFNIASTEQASAVANQLEANFLKAGGLLTSLVATSQQWDAPNGWAPLQWISYRGLRNYGHDALAEKLKNAWLHLNEKTYAETGKMMEKYNVADLNLKAGGGEYPNQDGFGWTNGVYLAIKRS